MKKSVLFVFLLAIAISGCSQSQQELSTKQSSEQIAQEILKTMNNNGGRVAVTVKDKKLIIK